MKVVSEQILAESELFRNIPLPEVKGVLDCLGSISRQYKKGETILSAGDTTDSAGVILAGSVYIEQTDIWGNQNIISSAEAGELFAETYASVPGEPLMVNVTAAKDCEILFFNIQKILGTCLGECSFHSVLVRNLLTIISSKNLSLTRKINHITPKSIRGRVVAYLSDQAKRQGSYSFEIPFNRQHLADYLCVDRSALSGELGKMRQEGLIRFDKNRFTLTNASPEQGSSRTAAAGRSD